MPVRSWVDPGVSELGTGAIPPSSETTRNDLRVDCQEERWECTEVLAPKEFARVRTRLILEHGKWDPQVGDVSTLARFPLIIPSGVWHRLAGLAERLAAEALDAEHELLQRPDLIGRLGLPRRVRAALAKADERRPTPAAARVMRFDFHPTPDGWRISEANSDVPGGYTEASHFPKLIAEHYPGTATAGDPAARLVEALAAALGRPGGHVALVSAAGYMEDQQVTAYLAALLRERGHAAHLARPHQIHWAGGVAHLDADWYRGRLDVVVRFYQGEWLALRAARNDWPAFFHGGLTLVCNPGSALLVESKRFPLVWDELSTPLATWKALLPPTRDPRAVNWRREPGWLLKTALCNTGDTVAAHGLVEPQRWREAALDATLHPRDWVAQRRFEVLPVRTPAGEMYPCLGVYTINGSAAGVYARIAPRPLIDFEAIDIAVLIRAEGRTLR